MRTIKAHLEVSLDGVVESPEKWGHSYFIDEMMQFVGTGMQESGTVLFGRKTYEEFSAYWPNQDPKTVAFAGFLNEAQKLIVSNTLSRVDWGPAEIISGDVESAVAELKEKPGADIRILGSPTLVGSLLRARLLDGLDLFIYPLLVGRGRRLFEDAEQVPMKLVRSHAFSNGVLSLEYEPA